MRRCPLLSCDLHCHTKLSDGSVGIEELISLAKRRGLHTIAITDHDTFAGAVRGVNIGKRAGVNVIPGAELSAVDSATGRKVHILCYNCASAARLEGLCRRTLESRKKAATEMLRRVMRYYPISPELVVRCATGSAAVYKQHIMHALMDAGFADSIFGEVFEHLFNKENGVAVAAVEYPDVRDVLAQVHEAGGIAVLAHPYAYDSTELMQQLVKEELLDGIEVHHPSHDEARRTALTEFATVHHLLMTGGSDFHGMYGKGARAVGSTAIDDDAAAALMKFKR
ncbi:MAG: PHP domain-containing protein [Clostridia bacterium]|nr:MAG: PHP domain-containing protein [Clostridia bacterium]